MAGSSTNQVDGDTPMHRLTVEEVDDDTMNAIIEDKRKRRMSLVEQRNIAEKRKRTLEQQKAKQKYERQVELFDKDLKTLDRALERLENRANKIRALRLQWEDSEDVLNFEDSTTDTD